MDMEQLRYVGELVKDLAATAGWVGAFWVLLHYSVQLLIAITPWAAIAVVILKVAQAIVAIQKVSLEGPKTVELRGTIDGMCITQDGTHIELIGQIQRIRGKAIGIKSEYIHRASVNWLRQAIDAKEAAEFTTNPPPKNP